MYKVLVPFSPRASLGSQTLMSWPCSFEKKREYGHVIMHRIDNLVDLP